jgi:quinol monooxygenase YgiN
MRFTRHVEFDILPGKEKAFRSTFDNEVVPVMKKQNGFRGELALVDEKNHAIGISLWENRESAEQYRTNTYPKVLETLKPMIQGSPKVETYEVATTTLK